MLPAIVTAPRKYLTVRPVLRTLMVAAVFGLAGMIASPGSAWAQDQGTVGQAITETPNISKPGDAGTAGEAPGTAAASDELALGSPDAPVTMIEYSSMTCPHCASFHTDTLPKLKRDFIDTGKLRLILHDFPFDGMALRASMLSHCVPKDRYFDFVDVLFKNQARWARSRDPVQTLTTFGTLVGMNADDVNACLNNEALQNQILTRQLQAQEQLNIRSTPTFILNGGADRIIGAEDYQVFKDKIDSLLPPDQRS